MSDWIEPSTIEAPEALRAAVGGHPLVAETLARRGFTELGAARAFLDPDYYEPAPSTALPGMVEAAERLERAIRQGEQICVWGDFDVDGQTSTTVLVSTLQDLGASAQYYIPNRQEGGHGVHIPILKRLIGAGVELVLTCDTGVTAHEAIAYAQAQGVDVIVTDHHDLPPALPDACAVTDPKLLPDDHPLRELPGVGVAYKLAQLLYERAGRAEEAAQYLDLVALGIVADVATQTGDTRYLLQRGLEALRRTERLGLQALIVVAELDPDRLTGEHIGFQLAPRLNSLGRLADATVAVEFLTTGDLSRARILASEMDGLNARRKLLCDQVFQGAQAQLERDPSLLVHRALVLSHPDWPAGIVGIVAGRLAE
ncbi:MAG: DHH family phosphoesterase, partial [Chloroflexota bacterium]|nr:DHH family phosphoesterase [Chloroflexota bacterium]